MRKLNLVLMVVLTLGVIGGTVYLAVGGPAPATNDDRKVDLLLRKLADLEPDIRRGAENELRSMGDAALPALRDAAASDDARLARRAKKLLAELEPAPVAGGEFSGKKPVAGERPEIPEGEVRFVIECPDPRVSSVREARFYVRLVNDSPVPVLILKDKRTGFSRLAGFEVTDAAGETVRAFTMPGGVLENAEFEPERIVVPPGRTYDLFAGRADGRAGLHGVGDIQSPFDVRFFYDAAEGGAYRHATEGATEGSPLPPERMLSNLVALRVR